MEKRNLILTGFMGTGKTTIGKLLAEKLNYTFVDTDHLIEEKSDMSIPDFFTKYGEKAFRIQETEMAKELGRRSSLVIGTGGGMMINPVNVSLLEKSGHIFCLTATAEEIYQRVSRDQGTSRPLLAGKDPMERITTLLRERKERYGKFTQINTTGKRPEDIANEIIHLNKSLP